MSGWKFDPKERYQSRIEVIRDFYSLMGDRTTEALFEQYTIPILVPDMDVVVSVIRSPWSYGGPAGLWEAAVIRNGNVQEPSGHLDEEQVRTFIAAAKLMYREIEAHEDRG